MNKRQDAAGAHPLDTSLRKVRLNSNRAVLMVIDMQNVTVAVTG